MSKVLLDWLTRVLSRRGHAILESLHSNVARLALDDARKKGADMGLVKVQVSIELVPTIFVKGLRIRADIIKGIPSDSVLVDCYLKHRTAMLIFSTKQATPYEIVEVVPVFNSLEQAPWTYPTTKKP